MKLSPFCVNLRAPFELFIGGEAKFKKMENVESIRGDGFRPCVTYTLLPFFFDDFYISSHARVCVGLFSQLIADRKCFQIIYNYILNKLYV